MARALVIGVMGAGKDADERDLADAAILGRAIAERGWVTLCGGRNAGVMAAVSQAAAAAGGLTVGILPDEHAETETGEVEKEKQVAPGIVLALPTGLGNARNAVNVLASDVVVVLAHELGPGTLSEAALALKSGRELIIVTRDPVTRAFLSPRLGKNDRLVTNASEAVARLRDRMTNRSYRTIHLAP